MNNDQLIKEIKRREWWNKLSPFPVYDTEIINDFKKLNMITSKSEYNNEPIDYCKTCLSIKIKTVEFKDTDQEVDYCIDCSNTELETAHVSIWADLYEEKYGETFLNRTKK